MSDAVAPGQAGRFPEFDVLRRAGSWDPQSREVVFGRVRLRHGGAPRFFGDDEAATARALVDRLLGQEAEPKIPVFELIDRRLADGETDGWRYEDMPDDARAWRQTLRNLDQDAAPAGFADLDRAGQIEILEQVRRSERWHGLPSERVWTLWMRYACAAFYSHPWAWNEIGFGGPAYPTGYKNLGVNGRESWEVAERDATDPEPWARRVERARDRHKGLA